MQLLAINENTREKIGLLLKEGGVTRGEIPANKLGFMIKNDDSEKIAGAILYSFQTWESQIIGKKLIKIEQIFIAEEKYAARKELARLLLDKVFADCQNHKVESVFVRFKENEVALLHACEETGFHFIETLLTLKCKNTKQFSQALKNNCQIVEYEEDCLAALQEIAHKSFQYSRFHADPFVDMDKAGLSRSEWIKNSCQGRAEKVFVAMVDGKVAGFNACKRTKTGENRQIGVIDLIAANPVFKNQGVGTSLVEAAKKYYFSRGLDLIVGTQAKNIPAINLYLKCGFKLEKAQIGLVKYFLEQK